MYIINTIPHGKCFVRYLRTSCWRIRNRTSERSERVRFLIQKQRVRKYRTPALSMKYSLFNQRIYSVPQTCKKLTTLVYLFGTNNNNLVSYSQVTIYEVGYSNAGPYSDSLLKKYRKYEIHFKASENSKKKLRDSSCFSDREALLFTLIASR